MNNNTRNLKANLAASYNELVSSFTALSCDTVGNYTVGKVIGKGSYGKAYQATHKFLGSKVVLKSTPKSEAPNLAREIHHHRHLHHPHIAQLYEVVVTENKVWLVLELCTNGELYDYLLSKGHLEESEAQTVFAQICGAVSYIHDKGIVHRDLKLENVFLDRKYNVKLGDFGFTRENDKSLLSTWCGSLSYCAPEVVRGEKYQGPPIDVWSLGIILYALLSGHLPFDNDNEDLTRNMIFNEKETYPASFSDDAKDLLGKMLNKSPALRPSASEVLAHPFLSSHSAIQASHLQHSYTPTFQTRMERTVLERLGVAGIETERVMSHVLDYRCDSLCGWWWLSLHRERRREKRHRLAAVRKSAELATDGVPNATRSVRHHSRSRNGSRDLGSANGPTYQFPALDRLHRDAHSAQISPNQSATNLPHLGQVQGNRKLLAQPRPSMPARESTLSSPAAPKRHASEPPSVPDLQKTPATIKVDLARVTSDSAERSKELQNRKNGIMQTFKHWWAEQTKSARNSTPSPIHTSPITPRAPLLTKVVQPAAIEPPTLPASPGPASPALVHQRPNYRRRRSSQLSVSSRGSSTVRSARRRTNPNLSLVLSSTSIAKSVGTPSPSAVTTPLGTYFDKSHPPMQRTMSASSNHSSVASYRGSGKAGHSKASSTSSNSTFASTRSIIRAPRNPLKVMPSTPPPFMIAHRGGYRERNVFESSLTPNAHGSIAFASRKKSKRGVSMQTLVKNKSRRTTNLHEVEEEEEEAEDEEEEEEEENSVLGEPDARQDDFAVVEEEEEEQEDSVVGVGDFRRGRTGLLNLAEEEAISSGDYEVEKPLPRIIVTD